MACAGVWGGELVSDAGERHPIVLSLSCIGSVVSGTAGPSLKDVRHATVTSGSWDAGSGVVKVEIVSTDDPQERIAFNGIRRADILSGTFQYGERGRGRFSLTPVEDSDS
jgi:hypothetical protein